MRFHSLPISIASLTVALLASPPCATAQFTFPPPLNGSLSDYTSGAATPTLNFSAGDSMFGGWYTPGRLMSFLVYRCTGSTKPGATIKPSNSGFNSTMGHTAPDKTWEQMPLYSGIADGFGNGFNSGKNPIWLHGEFFANNKTTGDLCWFELYPGHDGYGYAPDGTQERVATVNGDGEWYFATEPFKVNPARPNNLTVTWKSSGPKPDLFKNHTEAYWADFYREFPRLKTSTTGSSYSKTGGASSVFLQGSGWIGFLALMFVIAL